MLAFKIILELCSIALVMPAEGTFKLSVPVVPPPDNPLPVEVVMPVIVPVPGKIWPETNVTLPVWSILKVVPLMTRVESVLLGNNVKVSRTSVLPLTSRVAAGAVVAMPISEVFWKMTESAMSLVVSHMGM